MIKRLLIANRGEIACRIIRTARRMGVETVAVYSQVDHEARHVEEADHAVCIGPAPVAESYLDLNAIMAAAESAGADALHPGYGFLSESPALAEACEARGIRFVGPTATAMRRLGLKDEAKRLAIEAGVPVVPGYFSDRSDFHTLTTEARSIGFPLMVKAVAGGGGRGMRVVADEGQLQAALESAGREAGASFGEARLMLEKLVHTPRHVEVQVFGDQYGEVVHLFERDCSLQRRHQKVIEEAPAPGMSEVLREKLTDAAVSLAKSAGYTGAGTVEFLVEGGSLSDDAPFYFIEMNTRLQVEHPVTEAITGLDLVEWQLRIAGGEPLPLGQDDITHSGHAVELRIYAEDPEADFQPSAGTLYRFRMPRGEQIRIDTGLREGDAVTPYYDPMIAKIISHASDRKAALQALNNALEQLVVLGVATNAAFLRSLMDNACVRSGKVDTGLIGRELVPACTQHRQPSEKAVEAGLLAILNRQGRSTGNHSWDAEDSFQLGPKRACRRKVLVDGAPQTVVLSADAGSLSQAFDIATTCTRRALVWSDMRQVEVALENPAESGGDSVAGSGIIPSPITGRLAQVEAIPGKQVGVGDMLFVVEAMKMEHVVRSEVSGTIESVAAAVGDQVAGGEILVVIVPANGELE